MKEFAASVAAAAVIAVVAFLILESLGLSTAGSFAGGNVRL